MLNLISTAVAAGSFKTMAISVMKLNGNVHVGKSDSDCSNGVVHVDDALLTPN